jgi:predicted dehydrogenase
MPANSPQSSYDDLQLGLVGAAGSRADAYRITFEARDRVNVRAVCDVDESALDDAQTKFEAAERYTDYEAMLDDSGIDAVFVLTPQHLHASQATEALERDINVFTEVPAADCVEGARDLARAVGDTSAQFMMGENYTYFRPNVVVKQIVEAGLFGEVYYAMGGYINEMRGLMANTWRNEFRLGDNGVTYAGHQIGPVLSWLPDDRIARVTCAGGGRHYREEIGEDYELEDLTVMLGKTERDRLVEIQLDPHSNRPPVKYHGKYLLQGTRGSYESASAADERDKIWLEDRHERGAGEREFRDLADLEAEFLPERYRDPPPEFEDAGHSGYDLFPVLDFLDAVLEGEPVPIDGYRSLDISLPGIASRESIANDGEWVDVPDPREW